MTLVPRADPPASASAAASAGRSAADVSGRWAAVMGFILVAACLTLLWSQLGSRRATPFKSAQLADLQTKLVAQPKDEQIKAQIRAVDVTLRRAYFQRLGLHRSGAWLVLAAASLFLVVSRWNAGQHQHVPMPRFDPAKTSEWIRQASLARRAVGAFGVLLVLVSVAVALGARSRLSTYRLPLQALPESNAQISQPTEDFASESEMEQNWPRFRGPHGAAIARWPISPTAESTANLAVLWTSPLSAAGFNSPIIWGERLFLSGGDAKERKVLCYRTGQGELLWQAAVPSKAPPPSHAPEVPEQTGYAAATMATDGRRVYAIFANGDIVAFTFEGQKVWDQNLGFPKNPYGHASSLETWRGRLIVQWDQGEAEQRSSKLLALDGATGRTVWQRSRAVATSWATPLVFGSAEKAQIVTLAVPSVIAYNAADGTELWRVEGLNGEVTPSPIAAGGVVLAISPSEKIMAIRPDGRGNVTSSHVLWSSEDNVPDISSPVSNGELVFTITTGGMLTCYDWKDGRKVWEQDLEFECQSSPSLLGSRLCLIGTDGRVLLVEAGRTFRLLSRLELGEKVLASPAFLAGRMFVRGADHLFGLGSEGTLARSNGP